MAATQKLTLSPPVTRKQPQEGESYVIPDEHLDGPVKVVGEEEFSEFVLPLLDFLHEPRIGEMEKLAGYLAQAQLHEGHHMHQLNPGSVSFALGDGTEGPTSWAE